MNEHTRAALARIFEEWQRRYQADARLVYGPDVAPGYQVWTWPASPQSEGLKP